MSLNSSRSSTLVYATLIVWLVLLLHVVASCSNARYVKVTGPGTIQLSFRELQVWVGTTNVALSGTATQVSTDGANAAANCKDGVLTNAAVCKTLSTASPWWQVDLGSELCVDTIVFYNQEGTAAFTESELVAGGVVEVLDGASTVVQTYSLTGLAIELFHVNSSPGTSGRYVRIESPRQTVAFAMREVMVINAAGTNVATSGTATQGPSDVATSVATFCNDGNTVHNTAAMCEPTADAESYWEIDLGSSVDINRIVVYNRFDTKFGGLEKAAVLVLDTNRKPVQLHHLTKEQNVETVHLTAVPSCGIRYLRLQATNGHMFQEIRPYSNGVNLALALTATQTTDATGSTLASVCNDNFLDFIDPAFNCQSNSAPAEYWQIDFGADVCLDFIHYVGRPLDTTNDAAAILLLNAAQLPVRAFTVGTFQSSLFIVDSTYHPTTPSGCVEARYFRIERITANPIALEEIMVFSGPMNVALQKTATSSSVDGSPLKLMKYCVDGSNGWAETSTDCLTTSSATEWIEVDFGAPYCISHVVVYARGDLLTLVDECNIKLLDSAHTTVMAQWATSASYVQVFYPTSVTPPLTSARFVRLEGAATTNLHMREVQVWSGGTNVALSKSTAQYDDAAAGLESSKAVDGVLYPVATSVSSTTSTQRAFWQVDLAGNYEIYAVTLFNRVTSAAFMNNNALLVLDEHHVPIHSTPLTSMFVQQAQVGSPQMCGVRYVRMEIGAGGVYLNVYELIVASDGKNIALGKTATFDANDPSYDPARAVDGIRWGGNDVVYATWSYNGDENVWFEIDLGADYCIDYIHYVNLPLYFNEIEFASLLPLTSNRQPLKVFHLTQGYEQWFALNTTTLGHPDCINARYVRMQGTTGNTILTNEIQAFAGFINVAQEKTVTISGTGSTVGCVDGTALDYTGTYCQTSAAASNWIQVDLGEEYCLNTVAVYSSTNYGASMAGNGMVLLDGTSTQVKAWPELSDVLFSVFHTDDTPKNDTIRYIHIIVGTTSAISYREVKVIRNGVNLALTSTSYLSEDPSTVTANCNDNATDHTLNCMSVPSNDAWYTIDLGQDYDSIDAVVVYPMLGQTAHYLNSIILHNELWVPQRSFSVESQVNAALMYYVNEAAATANCGISYVRVEIASAQILNFLELEVYSGQVNVARDKPSTQRADQSAEFPASNCNDGYRDRNQSVDALDPNTMCSTTSSLDSWWEVDLLGEYCVDFAELYADYAQYARLDGAAVIFLNANKEPVRLFRMEPIFVNRMMLNADYRETGQAECQMGRYIRIERSGVAGVIMVTELEVFEGDFNVAFGKAVTLSALETGGYATSFATDGDSWAAQHLFPFSRTSTTNDANAWFQVDLGQEYCVDHIVWHSGVVGSTAAYKTGTTIKLLDGSSTLVKSWTPYLDPSDLGDASMDVEVFHVSPPRNQTAFIRARQGVNDALVMRELQAWSGSANVAQGKRAYHMQDVDAAHAASKCVDGDIDDAAEAGECQTTVSMHNFWEVDLGGSYVLDRVIAFSGKLAAHWTKMDTTDFILLNDRRVPIRTFNGHNTGVTTMPVATTPDGCGIRYITLITSSASFVYNGEFLAFKDGVNYASTANGATITSSSVTGAFAASLCMDGNRVYPLDPMASYCQTVSGDNEFIEVDLGQERCIDYIELAHRDDYKTLWNSELHLLAQSASREVFPTFRVKSVGIERFVTNENWKPQGNLGCLTIRKVRVERTTSAPLHFMEWQVLVNGVNVALGRACTKSSNDGGGLDNADVCGATDGAQRNEAGYYVHTGTSASEWIEVDLGDDYCVDSIVLIGHWAAVAGTYTADLILKQADDTILQTIPFAGDGTVSLQHFFMNATSTVTAYGNDGRYVVVRPDNVAATRELRLREVVVENSGVNYALAGTAGMVVDSGTTAGNCNDGSTLTTSFCLTTGGPHSQWVLDLGSTKQDIRSITVYNDYSATPANLLNAVVLLLNEEGNIVRSNFLTIEALTYWYLPGHLTPSNCGFRYVRVGVDANVAVGLSEVFIFSPSGTNLALGKTASQSSTEAEGGGQTYGPQVCNDGDSTTVSSPEKACLTTASWDAFWEVDLGQEECIEDIVIYNRAGSYMTSGIVELRATTYAVTRSFPLTSAQVQMFRPSGTSYVMPNLVRYVTILIQSGTLHMREVEISDGFVNLGLTSGRAKWMSTVKSPPNADGSDAAICTDGDTVSQANNAVCQTQTGDNQQWFIDLNQQLCVQSVKVFNRIDANSAALDRASILFYDTNWRLLEVSSLTSAAEQEYITSAMCTTSTPTQTVTKSLSFGDLHPPFALRMRSALFLSVSSGPSGSIAAFAAQGSHDIDVIFYGITVDGVDQDIVNASLAVDVDYYSVLTPPPHPTTRAECLTGFPCTIQLSAREYGVWDLRFNFLYVDNLRTASLRLTIPSNGRVVRFLNHLPALANAEYPLPAVALFAEHELSSTALFTQITLAIQVSHFNDSLATTFESVWFNRTQPLSSIITVGTTTASQVVNFATSYLPSSILNSMQFTGVYNLSYIATAVFDDSTTTSSPLYSDEATLYRCAGEGRSVITHIGSVSGLVEAGHKNNLTIRFPQRDGERLQATLGESLFAPKRITRIDRCHIVCVFDLRGHQADSSPTLIGPNIPLNISWGVDAAAGVTSAQADRFEVVYINVVDPSSAQLRVANPGRHWWDLAAPYSTIITPGSSCVSINWFDANGLVIPTTQSQLNVMFVETPQGTPRFQTLTSSSTTSGWELCGYSMLMTRRGIAISFTATLEPYVSSTTTTTHHLNATFSNPRCHPILSQLVTPVQGCAWASSATCDACECDANSGSLDIRLRLSSTTQLPTAAMTAHQSPATSCTGVNPLYTANNRNGTLSLQGCSPQLLHPTTGYPLTTTPQPLDVLFSDGRMISDSPVVGYAPDARVWVTAVSGCTDAYPSTGECPATTFAHQLKTITVTGLNFNSSMSLFFVSDSAPAVPCDELVVVSAEQMECRRYVGFGSDRAIELRVGTALLTDVAGPSTVRMSFTPGLEVQCGVNATGYLCSAHGSCDATLGQCVCTASATAGYWGGSACEVCSVFYQSSDCTVQCPGAGTGLVCSGHGTCSEGACTCIDGYLGSSCGLQCPGYGSPCSGHGTCNTTDETCICDSSSTDGYWDPSTVCSTCVNGWSGSSCNMSCPVNGAVCSGEGDCQDGMCICNTGFCGDSCETSGVVCNTCPSGQYGSDCSSWCPGAPDSTCSGHGNCDEGKTGTGVCSCSTGFAGAACNLLCAGGSSNPCSGHGSCSSDTGVCSCAATYGSSDCSSQCPGVAPDLCSGHGVCDEGSTGTGTCVCAFGYTGANCSSVCPGGLTNPCSLHGSCLSSGLCQCYADTSNGHWDGTNCDRCAVGWSGARCNGQCPFSSVNSLQCGGHGVCNISLECTCFYDATLGYWGGDACDYCDDGYFGSSCSGSCPGGSCLQCYNHGSCSQGQSGNGTCACHSNSTSGYWSASADCSDCVFGYYGYNCVSQCPTSSVNSEYCGGHGTCNGGIAGNGQCVCTAPYDNNVWGSCDSCLAGFYSSACLTCPTASYDATLVCSGHGTCSDGWAGTGACSCDVGYGTFNCEVACPVSSGLTCGGHGLCNASGCICDTNWALQPDGTCGDCDTNHFGTSCASTCPVCTVVRAVCNSGLLGDGVCTCPRGYWGPTCENICPGGIDAPCSDHGTCDANTGECLCHQNPTLGYWIGDTCSYCQADKESTYCNISCPVDGASEVCSGRASCWNGACSRCNAKLGDTFDIYCGGACDISGASNCASTCPTGFWGALCDQTCPGYDGVTAETSCSNRGICGVDGRCYCSNGYGGPTCGFTCPSGEDSSGSSRTCSAQGDCVADDTCLCYFGFTGTSCHVECPSSSTNNFACGGKSNGYCDVGGVCSCINGWVGHTCDVACPNSNTTHQCSGRGTCDRAGECRCDENEETGLWAGVACQECKQLTYGASCTEQCGENTLGSAGTSCICKENYGGVDCTIPCPGLDGELGVCSQHGSCLDGSSEKATCVCDADWYYTDCSVRCTVPDCIKSTQLVNPMCDNDGACVCQRTTQGSFDGPRCEDCYIGFWGLRCNLRCQCNDHGSCDRNSGDCHCFQDAVNGYWSGLQCDVCSKGYIGTSCRSRNVELSVNKHRVVVVRVRVQDKQSPTLLFQDTAFDTWYGGSVPMIVLNATNVAYDAPTYLTELTFNSSADRVVSVAILNSSHVIVLVNASESGEVNSYAVPRGMAVSASSPQLYDASVSAGRAQQLQVATSTSSILYSLLTASGTHVVNIHADGGIRQVTLSTTAEVLVGNWSTYFTALYYAELLDQDSHLIATGSRHASSATYATWQVLLGALPLSSSTVWEVYNDTTLSSAGRNPLAICQADAYGCTFADRCRLYRQRLYCFMTTSLSTPVMASFPLHSSTSADLATATLAVYSSPLVFRVTAIALDVDSPAQLLFIAINSRFQSSKIIKIRLEDTTFTGEITLTSASLGVETGAEPIVVTGFNVNSTSRELYAIASMEFQYLFISINLFGVKYCVPDVIDARGGTPVVITGEGFDPSASSVFCNFGSGKLAAATVVNETTIRCTATEAGAKVDGCLIHNFDVQVSDRATATTNVPVERPISVTIDNATSIDGVGYSEVSQVRAITINGTSFKSSATAKCAITYGSLDPNEWKIFAVFSATVLSTSSAYCFQSAGYTPSPAGARLRYSHDAVIYSESSIRYSLVGVPNAVRIVIPTSKDKVVLRSSLVTKLPPTTVHITDSNGNSAFQLDPLPRAISLTLELLTEEDVHEHRLPSAVSFGNNSVSVIASEKGVAKFDRLLLAKPPVVGTLFLTATVTTGSIVWTDIIEFIVETGDAYRIALDGTTNSWSVGTYQEVPLDPIPRFMLVDAAGNEVRDIAQFPRSVTLTYDYDTENNSTIRTIVSDVDVASRRYLFEVIKTRGRYGGTYTIDVATNDQRPLLPYRSEALQFLSCGSNNEFGRPGAFHCLPCPKGARCDGVNIVEIFNDYWRYAKDSFGVYSCPSGACVEGGCTDRYEGVRCSTCSLGYGKSGSQCKKCFKSWVNWTIMVILIICVLIFIFGFVLNSMGDPDTQLGKEKDRFPIVLKMLLTYLQIMGQAKGITKQSYSDLSGFFRGQEQASTLSADLPFITCEFRSDFNDEFVAMNLLPLILGLVSAVLVCGWKRFRAMAPAVVPLDSAYEEEREKNRRELLEEDPVDRHEDVDAVKLELSEAELEQVVLDISTADCLTPTSAMRRHHRGHSQISPTNAARKRGLSSPGSESLNITPTHAERSRRFSLSPQSGAISPTGRAHKLSLSPQSGAISPTHRQFGSLPPHKGRTGSTPQSSSLSPKTAQLALARSRAMTLGSPMSGAITPLSPGILRDPRSSVSPSPLTASTGHPSADSSNISPSYAAETRRFSQFQTPQSASISPMQAQRFSLAGSDRTSPTVVGNGRRFSQARSSQVASTFSPTPDNILNDLPWPLSPSESCLGDQETLMHSPDSVQSSGEFFPAPNAQRTSSMPTSPLYLESSVLSSYPLPPALSLGVSGVSFSIDEGQPGYEKKGGEMVGGEGVEGEGEELEEDEESDYTDDYEEEEADEEELMLRERIRGRGVLSRLIEATSVTMVVVLFLFYPTLLQTVSKMVQCETIELGDRAGQREVLIADRSIDCGTDSYASTRGMSFFLLLFWGFGIPAFSLALIITMSKLTLFGHVKAAHTLFFFMTGGIKAKYWFWEATVMARKGSLVMIVVLIPDDRLRIYVAVWLMLFFFVLHVTVLPYVDDRLSNLETASLAAILVTFNLLMLQPHFNVEDDPFMFYLLIVLVMGVNIGMFAVYGYMIIVTGHAILRRWAYAIDRLKFLQVLFDVSAEKEQEKAEALQKEIDDKKATLFRLRPTDQHVSVVTGILEEALLEDDYNDEKKCSRIERGLRDYKNMRLTLEVSLSRCRDPATALDEWYEAELAIVRLAIEILQSNKVKTVDSIGSIQLEY